MALQYLGYSCCNATAHYKYKTSQLRRRQYQDFKSLPFIAISFSLYIGERGQNIFSGF
jgi:hypothetical protein